MVDVGSRIKNRRKQLGYSAEKVAEIVGISPATMYRYEKNEIANMGTDKLLPIANVLSTTPAYLMGWTDDPDSIFPPNSTPDKAVSSHPLISISEHRLLKKYRALDEHGKDVIDTLLEKEYNRCRFAQLTAPATVRVISMQVFVDPAAAGLPLYAESEYERIDVPEDEVPMGAEFGVRISGDSMEPTVHNGQIAWIRCCSEIQDNRIGIFMLADGTAVCKRADVSPDGRVHQLLSDNPAYAPITGSALNGLRIVGEVLLK